MKIELQKVKIKDLIQGYKRDEESGEIVGYGGKLNIRPAYQREFIYNEKEKIAVIQSVKNKFPLNVFYWAKHNDSSFEIIDGQQRTLSICDYFDKTHMFAVDGHYCHSLPNEVRKIIEEYELDIYICDGTEEEKLNWFKVINIPSKVLTEQELRNIVYTGKWLSEAKKYFSKANCPAYNNYKDYLQGTAIRQDYLETVLSWIADRDKISIEEYMSLHKNDTNANELWLYFQNVMNTVITTFKVYRNYMKNKNWGVLYNNNPKFKNGELDPDEVEKKIQELIKDEDITKQSGIYEFIITGDEKSLSIRAFPNSIKNEKYEEQGHRCVKCGNEFTLEQMEADHITPWVEGGRTVKENCQLLCKKCNRTKSNK